MAKLNLNNLIKSFNKVDVLKGIDVEIKDGEFIVLVGPSGCGKSTLLRLIAGLEETTSGQITIGDKDVTHLAPKDRDISMVFQSYALYPHLSVRENIAFSLQLRNWDKDKIESTVSDVAETLGLSHLLDRRPKELSGGQRQRVAMGRAIVRSPEVFLFDEPLSNLDAKLRVQMRKEIKALHQRLKTTTVYVTHDQVEAMTLADRIVALDGGVIQQVGTPLELYDTPANVFIADFIGSPAMNFFEGVVSREKNRLTVKLDNGMHLPVAEAYSDDWLGQRVKYGVRPEDLTHHVQGDSQLPDCQVELIEPTGLSQFVHATLAGVNLVYYTMERPELEPGQVLQLSVDLELVHLFEASSGQRISRVDQNQAEQAA